LAFLEAERLQRRGVRLHVIGRRDRLARAVQEAIDKAESITSTANCLHLCIAIDYSSRDAVTRAAVEVAAALSNGALSSPDLFGPLLTRALGGERGEVDLLIRTGGEKRLSDFLLWESAYAELLFTDRMWPEFDETDLAAALDEFNRRERRFGAVPDDQSSVCYVDGISRNSYSGQHP
jgi:undecaprenyl diphosphate synthase